MAALASACGSVASLDGPGCCDICGVDKDASTSLPEEEVALRGEEDVLFALGSPPAPRFLQGKSLKEIRRVILG